MAEEEAVTTTDNVDEATEVATPETTEEVVTEEVKAESDTEGEAVEQEEKHKPDPKIAKAKFEARELRRENKRLAKMLETQIENVSKAKPEAKEPNIDDYDDIASYTKDLLKHEMAKTTSEETKTAPKTDTQDEYADVRDEMFSNGLEKYEDFEAVVLGSRSIMPSMAAAILDIDDPDLQVDVAYFVGNNPKEAIRIAKLSERRQIAEIAKIEVKLSTKAPATKKASKAPKPIKPVGGTKTPTAEIKETMSYDDFLKVRNKQLGR